MESPEKREILTKNILNKKKQQKTEEDQCLPTLLVFIGASRAAAVTRFQTVVLSVQVAVKTTVEIQVCVTVEQTWFVYRDSNIYLFI